MGSAYEYTYGRRVEVLSRQGEILTAWIDLVKQLLDGLDPFGQSKWLFLYKGNDRGTQYRSGIYFYTPEQEKVAFESKKKQGKILNRTIVTEILLAKKFYRAEKYHQQYLAKGGRMGFGQSAEKGCKDPIRCYG